MRIMDVLFTVSEQNQLGGQALQFLGLIPDQTPLRPDEEEQKKDPALETVKTDRPRPSPEPLCLLCAPGMDAGGAEPDKSGGTRPAGGGAGTVL